MNDDSQERVMMGRRDGGQGQFFYSFDLDRAAYRRRAVNRRFGPKPGIASFNSIDYDDRLIVASLF
jgi:hypothetical protein